MSILFWGITLGVIGKLMLALGILRVHYAMERERRIDDKVIASFHFEKIITIIGVIAVVIGYLMEMYFYNGANMLTCHGADCAASVYSVMMQ